MAIINFAGIKTNVVGNYMSIMHGSFYCNAAPLCPYPVTDLNFSRQHSAF